MTGSLLTNITIGALLGPGFRATIGEAVGGLGKMKMSAADLGAGLAAVGAAWGTLSALKGIKDIAADFEHGLMQAGITADMTNSQVASLRDQIRGLAVPDKTNQSITELLVGFNSLVSDGLDKDKATASLYAIGRTATASGAGVEDLSKTVFQLVDTLGVAPGNLTAELDRLAYAGKQGSFELRDMARYFPVLGSSAKAMGLQGTEAVATLGAALQIAKKGAADPSEAANNMKNFMSKITAGDTVKKFEAMGVNLNRVWTNALTKGENPMEKVLEIIQAKTKGDPFKLQKLFNDQQVLDFLKPMLANMDQYKKLKADIMATSGTVDTDFARMMTTNKAAAKGAGIEMEKLKEAIGSALIGGIGGAGEKALTPLIRGIGDLINSCPELTSNIVTLGSAAIILPSAFNAITIAWKATNLAVVFSPIGLAIGALAIGAALIIQHWGAVKGFFSTIWNGVATHWRTILAFAGPLGWMAIKIIDNWSVLRDFALGMWDAVTVRWQQFGDLMAPLGETISAPFITAWDMIVSVWDSGISTLLAMWDRIKGPLTDFAKAMGWIAPDAPQGDGALPKVGGAPGTGAIPEIGAAMPKVGNDNAVNDNRPGAGLAAAEQRGQAAAAGTSSASANNSSGGGTGGKIDVVVRFDNAPAGMKATATASGNASVSVFTGQAMSGVN